jgi:Tol biopolymer transport system component
MKKNALNLIKLLTLTIALALFAPVMIHSQAGKANFSGTWAFNEAKSTLSQSGGSQRMGGNITVTQEANLLTQTRTGQDGTQRITKYTLDGKESLNTTRGGESKSTATWSADGKKLTIITKMTYEGNERTSTSVWSLTDAKTLTIVSTRQSQDGEVKSTLVYDKK